MVYLFIAYTAYGIKRAKPAPFLQGTLRRLYKGTGELTLKYKAKIPRICIGNAESSDV